MKMNRNEITILRGETFTIDKFLSNQDGSPFIVSIELRNPHILLSIASSEYRQANMYVKHYWLPITQSFFLTEPIDLLAIKNEQDGISLYQDFDSIEELQEIDGVSYVAVGYYDGVYTAFEPSDCVFYVEKDGVKTYKYWSDGWKDYNFRIVKTFPQADTREWIPQTYLWSMQLVSGELGEKDVIDVFDTVQTLLSHTKLSVLSNLKGDI